MKRNCPDDKDNKDKDNKAKDKKFDKDGKIIGAVIDDDGSEDSVCMCATNEDSVICTAVEQRTFLCWTAGLMSTVADEVSFHQIPSSHRHTQSYDMYK